MLICMDMIRFCHSALELLFGRVPEIRADMSSTLASFWSFVERGVLSTPLYTRVDVR
jgi:hypothetical protein